MIELENLLRVAVEREASDIFIIGGLNPTFRRSGAIIHTGEERLLPPDTQRLLEQTYALAATGVWSGCCSRGTMTSPSPSPGFPGSGSALSGSGAASAP